MTARTLARGTTACLALGLLATTPASQARGTLTLEEKAVMIRAITYEETAPYLEARYTFRYNDLGESLLYICVEDNFHRLPSRPLLEWISRRTAVRMWEERHRLSPFVKDRYRPGDSPWGVFSHPEVREAALPLFHESKERLIQILQENERERRKAEARAPGRPPAEGARQAGE